MKIYRIQNSNTHRTYQWQTNTYKAKCVFTALCRFCRDFDAVLFESGASEKPTNCENAFQELIVYTHALEYRNWARKMEK